MSSPATNSITKPITTVPSNPISSTQPTQNSAPLSSISTRVEFSALSHLSTNSNTDIEIALRAYERLWLKKYS